MSGKVTKEMGIIEIVQNYPQALEVFAKYGLGCIGCAAARFEKFMVLTPSRWWLKLTL